MSCTPCKLDFQTKEEWEVHVLQCTKVKEEKKKKDINIEKTTTKDDPKKKKKSQEKIIKKEDSMIIEDHSEDMIKIQPYKCSRCKESYVTENDFRNHMENKHNKLPTDEKDALKLTSELSALLCEVPDFMFEETEPKEDLNQTVKETEVERPKRNKRKVLERINECDICKFKTTDLEEHNNHRLTKHKLGKSTQPPNGASFQIKRKLVTLNTAKYQCNKCNFETKNKAYLPQHVRKIHEKMPKIFEATNSILSRTISINSNPSPPNKTRKVTNNSITSKEKVHSKIPTKDEEQDVTEEELNLCYQKLLRGKSIREKATNTETENENKSKTKISDLEIKVTEMEHILAGASEVIQNLEEENDDLHKKVNYLGNNAGILEDLLEQTNKLKKLSQNNDQSCLLCDVKNITVFEMRFHIRTIHEMEEEIENEKDETIREWLKHLENADEEKEEIEATMKQLLVQRDNEIIELKETVYNKDKGLQNYETRVKNAEYKYKENEMQIETVRKENEELQNTIKLLKKVVKVTETKLKEKENEQNKVEQMEQDENHSEELKLFKFKSSGFSRTSPQSKVENKNQSQPLTLPENIKTYKCHICKQGGIPEIAAEIHLKSHREEGVFKCDDCSFQTNKIDILKNHSNQVKHSYTAKVQDFICETCGIEFETESKLKIHNERHKSTNDLKCKVCAQEFTFKTQLKLHMREAHRMLREEWKDIQTDNNILEVQTEGGGENECSVCLLKYNTSEALDRHIKAVHSNNPENTCRFCGIQFPSKNVLKNHVTAEHKTFKPCNKFASNNCEYDDECRYQHIILEGTQEICFTCGEMFRNKTDMMKHVKATHGGEPCMRFDEGNCEYGNKCLFNHNRRANQTQAPHRNQTQTQTQTPSQVFRPAALNQGSQAWPQINLNQPNQTQMMEMVTKMIPEMMSQLFIKMGLTQ